MRNVIFWYGISLKEAVSWAGENPLRVINKSKMKSSFTDIKRFVWWEKKLDGWRVRATQTGDFLYTSVKTLK